MTRTTAAPRTANATKAAIIHRAQRRAADPRKREHATLTVAAGMVAGTITVDDLADHIRRIVDTAPAPSPDTIDRLRVMLPATDDRLNRTEAEAA